MKHLFGYEHGWGYIGDWQSNNNNHLGMLCIRHEQQNVVCSFLRLTRLI